MADINGFELLREQHIPEINSTGKLFRHTRTDALVVVVENADENKAFNIAFRTPPPDSTGLPHILEHSVLGGSEKYPVKEPFMELVKGSLKTFINAFTSLDWTSYPVASQNRKDFYNLFEVYMDAVLHPTISEQTLAQEGWHYELESLDSPLSYKGVVFNEMKGAFSDPDGLLYRYIPADLFPDTPYKNFSAGDPAVIPDLTYEQFTSFYRKYYHPANSLSWFYGDGDTAEHLRHLAAWFEPYTAHPVDSIMPLQKPFDAPRRSSYPFDAGEEQRPQARLALNWMVGELDTPEKNMALMILTEILLGTPASPLRKALIDSGLGEDVIGGGEDATRQAYFTVGLKGMQESDADQVEALILDTLTLLVKEGIESAIIQAAVNTIEFRLREMNTGTFPRGLALMFRALTAFTYGRDPLAALPFEEPLQMIKDRLAAGEKYFENYLQSWFLDNNHRLRLLLFPQKGYNQELQAAEQTRLAKERAAMSPADLEKIIAQARALKQLQETPDSPEALATIPTLTLADLDGENKIIPLVHSTLAGVDLLYHDLPTSGILYLDLGFDLHTLPAGLLPLTGVFGRALLEMGAGDLDFVALTLRIKANTGGINPASLIQAVHGQPASASKFVLRGKATVAQASELFGILQEVLLSAKLDDRQRFRQILLEEKAGIEAGLVPMGHRYAALRLGAQFSEAGWAAEQVSGITSLFALRQLGEQVDTDWPAVLEKLEEMRRRLLTRQALLANVTLDSAAWGAIQPHLAEFLSALPDMPYQPSSWSARLPAASEGLSIPAQVNYVVKGANIFSQGFSLHGAMHVAGKYMARTWLHNKIRAQGGAYGAFGSLDPRSGVWAFGSYHDPNLLDTLQAYDGSGDYLRDLANGELSKEELVRAVIGWISDWDTYLLPDAKGFTSLVHWLTGETVELRQHLREQMLNASHADFARFAEVMDAVRQHGSVVVLGSQSTLEKANQENGGFLNIQQVM